MHTASRVCLQVLASIFLFRTSNVPSLLPCCHNPFIPCLFPQTLGEASHSRLGQCAIDQSHAHVTKIVRPLGTVIGRTAIKRNVFLCGNVVLNL